MQFDDRLATVLRFRADGAAVQRVQLRQLFDLLGKGPLLSDGAQEIAAYSRLGELAQAVPPAEQAQMLGDSGLRLRAPRLVALLANAAELPVACSAKRQPAPRKMPRPERRASRLQRR